MFRSTDVLRVLLTASVLGGLATIQAADAQIITINSTRITTRIDSEGKICNDQTDELHTFRNGAEIGKSGAFDSANTRCRITK